MSTKRGVGGGEGVCDPTGSNSEGKNEKLFFSIG